MSDVTAVPIKPVKRAWIVWLGLGIAVAAIVAIALAWSGTAKARAEAGDSAAFMAWHKGRAGVIATPSGLQYQVIKPGEGATPTDADVALINYKGELRDGKVFDQNSRAPLPVAGVVPGFAEALKLMPRGAKFRVWIPPELGYGAQAQGDAIPANSVLIFDIEMIDFRNQAQLQAEMQAMQAQQGAQPAPPLPPQP